MGMERRLGEFGRAAIGRQFGGLAGNRRVMKDVFHRQGAEKALFLRGYATWTAKATGMAARLGIGGWSIRPQAGRVLFRDIGIGMQAERTVRDIVLVLRVLGIRRLLAELVGLGHRTEGARCEKGDSNDEA